jgi:phenylacetate-CoA ligase
LLYLQFKKLQFFLERVYEQNPYWREKFDEAKVDIKKIKSIEDFQGRIPFSDKGSILEDQEAFPMYGKRLGVPLEDVTEFHLSSGTSGLAQEVHSYTAEDVELAGTLLLYHFIWAGLKKGDAVAVTLPFSTTGFPLAAFSAIRKLGGKPFMIGTFDNRTRLETMHRFPVKYVQVTPVYLTRLVEVCEDMGVEPGAYVGTLAAIGVSAGSYPVFWARKMEDLWQTCLSEFYACSGAGGAIAATCEQGIFESEDKKRRGGMHLYEHIYVVEILNPETLKPVAPGEDGEVVVTNLDKIAEPVVRYRTRDTARYLGADCPCGRPFAMIECGSIGRRDDMIKVRGINIWPVTFDELVFSREEVREYNGKVVVDGTGRERVTISLEYKVPLGETKKSEVVDDLKAKIKRRVGLNVDILEAEEGDIEHFEFKTKRWKDLRQESLDRIVS